MAAIPTVDCASLPALEQWALLLDLRLDFGGAPDACSDCVLPLYYCYEGQEPPPLSGMKGALGAAIASFQGSGITCLDSQPLRLAMANPSFALYGAHTAWITPTQTISLHHSIWNWSLAPITVTLDHGSTLDLPWGVYSGTEEAPDLPLAPIEDPIRLGASFPDQKRDFWLIATAPAGMPWGACTLVITATDVLSPALTASIQDLLWVGDWVAPPAPWQSHGTHLPLVLKN